MFSCHDLIELFNALFEKTEQTVLISGGQEPLYLPKDSHRPVHQIIFTQDYFASALHEIAHWCIAGNQRRQLMDYGYWYQPDGRSSTEQTLFEQAEVKPQALEWIFAVAAGSPFYVSADNLTNNLIDNHTFKQAIYRQALEYLERGLPRRAELFKTKLLDFYRRTQLFNVSLFHHHLL